MKLDDGDAKKDIDITKMYNMTLCMQNKDEIMKYVLNDSISIYKIHK